MAAAGKNVEFAGKGAVIEGEIVEDEAAPGWEMDTNAPGYKSGKVGFAQLAQATRTDARSALGAITAPALVVGGTRDALCPPEFHREIADQLAGAELHVVPDAGHLLPLEAPAAVLAAAGREKRSAVPKVSGSRAESGKQKVARSRTSLCSLTTAEPKRGAAPRGR